MLLNMINAFYTIHIASSRQSMGSKHNRNRRHSLVQIHIGNSKAILPGAHSSHWECLISSLCLCELPSRSSYFSANETTLLWCMLCEFHGVLDGLTTCKLERIAYSIIGNEYRTVRMCGRIQSFIPVSFSFSQKVERTGGNQTDCVS